MQGAPQLADDGRRAHVVPHERGPDRPTVGTQGNHGVHLPGHPDRGDGSPLREFLYVDDLANLCVFLMNTYSGNETVNAGTGKEISIKELAELVARIVGYSGEIRWDTTRPNGTPRKLLDVSKTAAMGWHYQTELEEGIRKTYEDFLRNPMRAER